MQVLHEELMECSFVNNLHPGDTVGALTFVLGVEEDVGGDLEAITMRTVGVENVDVSDVCCQHTDIPDEMPRILTKCGMS